MVATIENIQSLLEHATLEVTPASAAKVENFQEYVLEGTTIYVTFLPGSDFQDTLAVVRRLKDQGMHPVTHLAARSIVDSRALEGMLSSLADLQASQEVLIIGGGVDRPIGQFDSSFQLLETGLFSAYGVQKIGIAGHPEGSPDIPKAAVKQALKDKLSFAQQQGIEMYIATQFCFEAQPIIDWHDRLYDWDCLLPIHIGLPGPATIKTLLRFAQIAGIGNSMRFIKKQASQVTKLLRQQAPDQLISDLALYQASTPDCRISHCHVYPFAGFAKTATWLRQVQQGKIVLSSKEGGFCLSE